jgi:hypothetical protein
LPPATLRLAGQNLPVAGGGYFRLFPLAVMTVGMRQLAATTVPPVAMLYFHPWEFDPLQPRLPLGRASRFRTYVGLRKTTPRLKRLLAKYTFQRACDVADAIHRSGAALPTFSLAGEGGTGGG